MKYYQQIDQFSETSTPLVLTIGAFDGVHAGHQQVIEQTIRKAKTCQGKSVLLTFSNHPSEILTNRPTVPSIYTINHKVSLLADLGIDYLVQIPFTAEFSIQTPQEFINSIRQYIPFDHLILGYDARFGKNRQGDRKTVERLGEESGFTVRYIEPVELNGLPISSSRIRHAIENGQLTEASKLLSRPYSILSKIIRGNQQGSKLGYPTLNIDVSSLCLPPLGVYAIYLQMGDHQIPGVANLGIAPTLKKKTSPVFEAFLFSQPPQNPQKTKESIQLYPLKFLRPEKQFPNTDDLIKQIAEDVQTAKEFFSQNPIVGIA